MMAWVIRKGRKTAMRDRKSEAGKKRKKPKRRRFILSNIEENEEDPLHFYSGSFNVVSDHC